MFRQVVAYRWVDEVTDEDKAGFYKAFEGLRSIPELTSLRFAEDARYFDGNFDVVAVMDFPDFAAARRYVADERHQSYIREYASKLIGERVVVQHNWAEGAIVGVHRIALPVSDVTRSSAWYTSAFGLVEVPSANAARDAGAGADEVTLVHPTESIALVLRNDPPRANALAGFDAISFAVGTVDDLDAVIAHLESAGIAHGPSIVSSLGMQVDVADPDGIVVRLTTLVPAQPDQAATSS
jgi:catechol 2,3-dioxygenase-like lactoylglutathione lyase family enzyme